MFSLCFCALKKRGLPHVYKQYVAILHRNSSWIYEKCVFYCSGSLKMHVRDTQNTLHILEVCSIDFLAPTAVKHAFFIDPNGIAVQTCHIFTIIMFGCV